LGADGWTRRALVSQVLSMVGLMVHARSGARLTVARKLVYDFAVARRGTLYSILRDIAGLKVHTTERVVELPLVERMISREDKSSRILEVGSGESPFLLRLARKGYGVVSADVHAYPFCMKGVDPVRADVLRLPFIDGSFDVVFAISTIEHIGLGYYGDTVAEGGDATAVRELRRVLAKSGRLIVTVPFGSQPIPNFERVYNARTINNLLSEFRVVEESYWVCDGGKWIMVPKENAMVGPPLRENGTMAAGVVIVSANKQM